MLKISTMILIGRVQDIDLELQLQLLLAMRAMLEEEANAKNSIMNSLRSMICLEELAAIIKREETHVLKVSVIAG